MAKLTREGRGVRRDTYRAYILFSQAAEKGHPAAQIEQGLLLAEGSGVQCHLPEAVPLLTEIPEDERGARIDWIFAQAYPGGRDLDFDAEKAVTHWHLAAKGGNQEALDTLLALLVGTSELAVNENPHLA